MLHLQCQQIKGRSCTAAYNNCVKLMGTHCHTAKHQIYYSNSNNLF